MELDRLTELENACESLKRNLMRNRRRIKNLENTVSLGNDIIREHKNTISCQHAIIGRLREDIMRMQE